MFAITKLSRDSQDFLSSITANNKSRSIDVSIAISRIIAYKLPMPSAPVENAVLYFKTQCQNDIEFTVGAINEIVILDLQTILDLTMKFFQWRYQSIFANTFVFALKKGNGIVDFFDIGRYFDETTIKAIADNPIVLTDYVNNFNRILDELKADDGPQY